MHKKQEIEILIKTLSSNPYIIEFFDNVLSNSILLENLFKRKTIVWTNGQLVLLNNDFISKKSIEKK